MNAMTVRALPDGGFLALKGATSVHECAPYLAAFTTLDEALQYVRQQMKGSVQQGMSVSEQAAQLLESQRAQVRTVGD